MLKVGKKTIVVYLNRIKNSKLWAFPMEIFRVQNVHKYLSLDKLGFLNLNPCNINHIFHNLKLIVNEQ